MEEHVVSLFMEEFMLCVCGVSVWCVVCVVWCV